MQSRIATSQLRLVRRAMVRLGSASGPIPGGVEAALEAESGRDDRGEDALATLQGEFAALTRSAAAAEAALQRFLPLTERALPKSSKQRSQAAQHVLVRRSLPPS